MRQCGDIDSGRRIERRRAIHDSGSVGVRRANSSRGGYRGAAIAVPGRVHRANGRQALPIRPGPDFEASCSANSEYNLQPNKPGARSWEVPALIGMDTLIEFDAFGWELNPFRMYFVPKGRLDS